VEEKISGDQRRYFLMEQLKAIKKELGLETDDKTALTGKTFVGLNFLSFFPLHLKLLSIFFGGFLRCSCTCMLCIIWSRKVPGEIGATSKGLPSTCFASY
jgi:hypothetical protein